MQFSFEKKKRFVSSKQFKAVLARNLRASNGLLTLFMAENDCDYPRLGVSVSKSCGSAVVRNRLKRLLREAFRQSQDRIPAGFDYLLMISPKWSKKVYMSSKSSKLMKPTFQQAKGSFIALVAEIVSRTKNSNLSRAKPVPSEAEGSREPKTNGAEA